MRRVVTALVVCLSTGLAGCSTLPGQGPSASDVAGTAQSAPNEHYDGYLVTRLDSRVAGILARKNGASFHGRFADHRPAPSQVIGVGDALLVTIWEAAAGGLFSSPVIDRASPGSHTATIPEQVVARDGSVTVPYAGRIQVAGLTPPEVERRVVKALSGKAIEPQVLVTISRNLSNSATVAGEVTQGARVPLSSRGDRILDVVATAGGIRSPVHETFITLTRGGRSATVPMQVLLTSPEENIFVWPGDTLTLTRSPQSFTAFGASGRNALVTFDALGISLEEAVAKAGGLLEYQADPSGVFLLRSETAETVRAIDPSYPIAPGVDRINVVYRVDMRDTNTYFLARQVRVENKDIVYIATAPINDLQKILQLVQMTASPAATARTLAN
ncbi:polysaccharide biosynthesis/export family protein [Siculibacillus lacustris]|uniref:polysaccharide biosynthesis/export family protein n=1 Tax=Siculibacillus lacustris TaxID=1549641 RepID=UPI001D189045|nr:polysaccharide biosynthesis/export family protein [Siculibacillus lacustris]